MLTILNFQYPLSVWISNCIQNFIIFFFRFVWIQIQIRLMHCNWSICLSTLSVSPSFPLSLHLLFSLFVPQNLFVEETWLLSCRESFPLIPHVLLFLLHCLTIDLSGSVCFLYFFLIRITSYVIMYQETQNIWSFFSFCEISSRC